MSSVRKRPLAHYINRKSVSGLFWNQFFFNLVIGTVLTLALLYVGELRAVDTLSARGTTQAFSENGITFAPETSPPKNVVSFKPRFLRFLPAGDVVRGLTIDDRTYKKPITFFVTTLRTPYILYLENGVTLALSLRTEISLWLWIMGSIWLLELWQLIHFSRSNYWRVEHQLWPLRALHKETQDVCRDPLHARFKQVGNSQETLGIAQGMNQVLDTAAEIHTAYGQQARFVADASHELRTPIAVIQGYVNMLGRWGKDDPNTLQEAIVALKNEADGMQQLVEQLLFLSRGENGAIPLQCHSVDASALLQEIYNEALMIDEAHVYRMDIDRAQFVAADAALLKQSLRVLLDNARKFTATGGEITLSCKESAETVRLSVEDTGIGIPQEDVPRIFDRFFRADESRARKTGGSGLGLSIAKWIIDRHQGVIEVLSRHGLGTRITFVLAKHTPKTESL